MVADLVLNAGDHLVGFLTDDRSKKDFMGWPVLGEAREYCKFLNCCFVVAIGDAGVRERMSGSMDCEWYTAVHPSAAVSAVYTSIGEGSVIMANAIVNPYTRIGSHCIINSNATVEHDNRIEDFVHISVGARIGGTVRIGRRTWVGIGATVSNGINICQDCMIGAGAVVVRDMETPGTYIGVPARKLR